MAVKLDGKTRLPIPQLLLVRTANQAELGRFAELTYTSASPGIRALITRDQLLGKLRTVCDVVIVTDCLNTMLGGLVLDHSCPEAPILCWAYLREDVQSAGLARDMTRILIGNYMALGASALTAVSSFTASYHAAAAKGLRAMHFTARELVFGPETELSEIQVLAWSLSFRRLTSLLDEARKLPLVVQRPVGSGAIPTTVQFNHPLTTDPLLRLALDTVVRERLLYDDEE